MSTEENKAIARRWYEESLNKRNLAIIDELFTTDFMEHNPQAQSAGPGREGAKRFIESTLAPAKEVRVAVEDMIAERDKVVTRYTVHVALQGDFMGIPAAGKTMTVTSIDILRFEGGRIAEHWIESDTLGMMQQLGVIPTPGQAPG